MAAVGEKFRLAAHRSFGVASARHTSGIVVKHEESPYLLDVPLGPSVIRWDLQKNERIKEFQVKLRLCMCVPVRPVIT